MLTWEPSILALAGRAGTGKTTLSKIIAPYIKCTAEIVTFNTDVIRKEIACISQTERLSEEHYTEKNRDLVYNEIVSRAICALREGRNIIWDASFGRMRHRRLLEEFAARNRADFFGIMLEAPMKTRAERVELRGSVASDADAYYVMHQEVFEELLDSEGRWQRLYAGASLNDTAHDLLTLLQTRANG